MWAGTVMSPLGVREDLNFFLPCCQSCRTHRQIGILFAKIFAPLVRGCCHRLSHPPHILRSHPPTPREGERERVCVCVYIRLGRCIQARVLGPVSVVWGSNTSKPKVTFPFSLPVAEQQEDQAAQAYVQ